MAYADIGAKSTSDTLTLNNWNGIRNNFLAGVPGIFTTKGDIVIATGSQVATRVGIGADDSTLVADSNQPPGAEWQIQPAARVYHSNEVLLADASWVDIPFNSERYDTDATHTTVDGTGVSRLSCPASGTGIYYIGGNIMFGSSALAGAGNRYGVRISLNSLTPIAQETVIEAPSATNVTLNISTVYPLTGGTDYVTLQGYHTDGQNLQVSGNFSPEFYMHWLRRT